MKNRYALAALILVIVLGCGFLAGVAYAANYKIFLNGKALAIATQNLDGKVWVPVQDFAKALNMKYSSNPADKTINLTMENKPDHNGNHGIPGENLKNKYLLRIEYVTGSFKIDLEINGVRLKRSYIGEVEEDITRYMKKGKNDVKILYEFAGEHSSFYLTIVEKNGESEKVKDVLDRVYREDKPQLGQKNMVVEAE